jgi:hypothetical protein
MSKHVRRARALATAATLVGSALVGLPAAPAQAAATTCLLTDYVPVVKMISVYNEAKITHRHNYTMPAHWKKTITKSASYQRTIRAEAHADYEESGSAGFALKKISAKVSQKFSVGVKAAVSRTTSKAVSVTTEVSNPTNHDQTWVFFSGNTRYHGAYKESQCVRGPGDPSNPKYGHVVWQHGSWQTFTTSPSRGAIGCGNSTEHVDSVAKLAQKLGCA